MKPPAKAINPRVERDIEDAFVKYAAHRGCVAEKLVTLGKRNFPDRTVFCPRGRLLFIEFKMPNKEPTPGQEKKIERLRKLGFQVHVCDNYLDAVAILDAFLEATPKRIRPRAIQSP